MCIASLHNILAIFLLIISKNQYKNYERGDSGRELYLKETFFVHAKGRFPLQS
jgi:hypothetical protein